MPTAHRERSWTLELLGRERLVDADGSAVVFRVKHALLLLVVLVAAQEEPVSRPELAQIIWPDAAPDAARDSLRNALAMLRGTLPDGAVIASTDSICLQSFPLICDWLTWNSHRDYRGDFMPSYSQEWVIDHRLALRARASDDALQEAQKAWSFGDNQTALELSKRAAEIDPWNEEAVRLRIQFLEESGQRSRAVLVADQYRSSAIRNLGIVPTVSVHVPNRWSNLIGMTEWLLDRNPEESVAMIAATPSEWLNTPVRIALDIHDRALAACAVDSPERRLVACQRLQLIVCTGSLDLAEDAERDLEEATRVGEMLLAGRLSCALAYGYLSKGDFKRSQQFARRALTYGAATNRPGVEADFGINLSIVLDHVGQREESRALLQHYGRQVDDFGSPQQVAGKELQKVEPYLENGKIDLAQRSLDASRRLFASCDAGRMEPWVRLGDAMISVALGENAVAHRILSEIRTIDPGIGGQAVIAMADDWLAKVDCKLGEFESAAEALVRAQKFRRSLGTVPSVAERTNIRNTHQVLMERLGERELRAAYRRGARTPVPRAHAGN